MGQEPFKHVLKHPRTITFSTADGEARGELLTEITIRPCERAKDLRAMDNRTGEFTRSIALVAHLSGQTENVIDELHPDDYYVLVAIAQGFTPPGPAIGTTA